MRGYYLLGLLSLVACTDHTPPEFARTQKVEDAAKREEGEFEPGTEDDEKKQTLPKVEEEESQLGRTETQPPAADPAKAPQAPAAPAAPAEFVVDPDTLSFFVVLHLSPVWTEQKLRPVVAEVERILAQAKIEILPIVSTSLDPTDDLDVFFVNEVPGLPGVNGASFGNDPDEIYVINNVGLNKVDDKRPAQVPVPRFFADAKPGDKIAVTAEEAEQARTTAHEICHQLGLRHREESTNLLASGTTGWTLNETEIATVRRVAVERFQAQFVKIQP